MAKMITLFGREIKELSFNELKRERRGHSFLLTRIRYMLKDERKELDNHQSEIRQDKVYFLELYEKALEAMLKEIDYWLDRRAEPLSNANGEKTKESIRTQNANRRRRFVADSKAQTDMVRAAERIGFSPLWDREKFLLIANDRGYQTEEIVISEIGKELNLDRTRARLALDHGRLTWGQVLALGAMMQMTPKEFCDTFLAGYFTEQFGEYRADPTRINKVEVLKRAVKPQNIFEGIEKVEIDVGADGKPLDEEEWF